MFVLTLYPGNPVASSVPDNLGQFSSSGVEQGYYVQNTRTNEPHGLALTGDSRDTVTLEGKIIYLLVAHSPGPPPGWPLLHSYKNFFPTLDNLRNFLLSTTTEVLSFFQHLRESAVNLPGTPSRKHCRTSEAWIEAPHRKQSSQLYLQPR